MPKSDIDVMIEVLEEAARRSLGQGARSDIGNDPQRLRIIMDLIDEGMLRGQNLSGVADPLMPSVSALRGINLKGRRYLQELKDYKRNHGFLARFEQVAFVLAGALLVLGADIAMSFIKLWWKLP